MTRTRLPAVAIALALVAATCGEGDDEASPLSLSEYTAELRAIETEFQADSPTDPDASDARDPYPIGADLVTATELYMAYDQRLARWEELSPPAELSGAHVRFVDALGTFKEKVGDYLMEEALDAEDFDFEAIAPKVASYIEAAALACRELRSALALAGASVEFAGNCTF